MRLDHRSAMLTLALLLAGLAAVDPPCAAPHAPTSVRVLLPRVIVEGGPGPSLVVWLSWSIGATDVGPPNRVPRRRGHRWHARPPDSRGARLDAEEEAAMGTVSRCP